MLKITKKSHLDHGLTTKQLAHVLDLFGDATGFFIQTIELPAELGTVPCGLHGPLMGDEPIADSEVILERRGTRAWESRLIDRPMRQTNKLTIVAGPSDNDDCVLYTCYGGMPAPREPGTPDLTPEQLAEASQFWAEHALSISA